MTAIAYVTDEKMIEYHRVNGSHSIVFWRISSKKFSNFKNGDLLFFLSKDNAIRKKEKGLVGYGVYKGENLISVDLAWKKYGKMTGYLNKDEFSEAIVKSSKSNELPKKISCLLLEKVIYFASPIYLSELGYNISNKLESFMYLHSEKDDLIEKILNNAEEIGIDSWSLMQNDHITEGLFNQQLMKYRLLTIMEPIENSIKVPKSIAKSLYNKDVNEKMWITSKEECYLSFGQDIEVKIFYYTNPRKEKEYFYYFTGLVLSLKEAIKNKIKTPIKVSVIAITKIGENKKTIFYNNEIDIIEVKNE